MRAIRCRELRVKRRHDLGDARARRTGGKSPGEPDNASCDRWRPNEDGPGAVGVDVLKPPKGGLAHDGEDHHSQPRQRRIGHHDATT